MFKQHVQHSIVLDLVFNSQLYLAGKIEFNRVITKMIITKYAGCHSNVTLSREGTGRSRSLQERCDFSAKTKRIRRRNLDLVLSQKDQEAHRIVELERHSRFSQSKILI